MEWYSGGTLVEVALGEVGHSRLNYVMLRRLRADYESSCTRAYSLFLKMGPIWIGRFAQVCDNNGSNFPGLCRESTFVQEAVAKTRFARCEGVQDMRIAEGSRFEHAVASACLPEAVAA